jgi:hypothetical protein
MIFRNSKGELIEINKYEYSNDMIYYEKIMNIQKEIAKCNNEIKNNSKNSIVKNIFNDNTNLPTSEQINKICKFIKL